MDSVSGVPSVDSVVALKQAVLQQKVEVAVQKETLDIATQQSSALIALLDQATHLTEIIDQGLPIDVVG